ncbi:hypothetical protein ABVK25_003629 [Lepraria finkii]|uniref:Uncharacterized protein n=1 Tax=Lepraria finkii TaxID=1340010 RepID=A0ABR4BDR3_9LECA
MFYFPFMLAGLLTLVTSSTYSSHIRAQGVDPHMVYYGGQYYLLNSQIDGHIQMVRATTLDLIKDGETRNFGQDSTPSRCCGYWAPEQHQINGT